MADIVRLLLRAGLEVMLIRPKNSESVFSQDVTKHLEFTKSIECEGKIALKKMGVWGIMFFPMFNKNLNRTVYMLQFISLYNSSKTFQVPYMYTYTTRIAQKLVRSQYHLPGETTHRTKTPSNITQLQQCRTWFLVS